MMKNTLRVIGAVALSAFAAGCVHQTEPPPLSGPSTSSIALSMTATPDSISQDGASQASVAIQAIGPDGRSRAGLVLRVNTAVGGQIADYGTLSARTIVTGNDGIARVIYTAPPPAPPPADTTINRVSVVASAIGNDAQTSVVATADIRLYPLGVILPPGGSPTADFTFGPTPASVNVPLTFDASSSQPGANATRIASYSWNFGDGTSSNVGPAVTHSYAAGGSFNVSLTVTNDRGLTATKSQTVAVSATDPFTGDWVISPLNPVVNSAVLFNADQVQTSPGHQITQYNWTFGDGGSGTGFQVQHTFTQAATYNVVLSVQDDLGRKKVFAAKPITVGTGAPVVAISFSPSTPSSATLVSFNANGTVTVGGATIVSYQWDFGDPGSGVNNTSTLANPQHQFSAAGSYRVTLTVTDSQGRVGVGSTTVPVS